MNNTGNNYEINDFEDYCSKIVEIKKKVFESENKKVTLWYRGQANKNWDVTPSVQRNGCQNEQVLCNSFYHRVSQILPEKISRTSYDQWISLMQHYGLPTRLLDWSYSPLVALFFAIKQDKKTDGKDARITIISPEVLNGMQNFGYYIYPIDSAHSLKMLELAFKKEMENNSTEKILACFPTSNDLRMYAQKSAFTIHDTKKSINEICQGRCVFNLIIKAGKKSYFRDILNTLDFTESLLFPDIDHIAKQVIERYNK